MPGKFGRYKPQKMTPEELNAEIEALERESEERRNGRKNISPKEQFEYEEALRELSSMRDSGQITEEYYHQATNELFEFYHPTPGYKIE